MADAEKFIGGANKDGEAAFLMTLRDKTVIGACGIMFHYDETPELGYWLGVPYWNKGYATEALHALIDYAFTDLTHESLQAGARVTNPASRRVLEKCGFQWTGVGLYRINSIKSSAPIDRFRLERGIWTALKTWGRVKRVSYRHGQCALPRLEGGPSGVQPRLAQDLCPAAMPGRTPWPTTSTNSSADCRSALSRDPGPAGREQVRQS